MQTAAGLGLWYDPVAELVEELGGIGILRGGAGVEQGDHGGAGGAYLGRGSGYDSWLVGGGLDDPRERSLVRRPMER